MVITTIIISLNLRGEDNKLMTISPSLPALVEGEPLLRVTISNVEAEPTSLKISGSYDNGILSYEIYGEKEDTIIGYNYYWDLLESPTYANGEVTFAIRDHGANGSLEKVEITVNGKTTTFE